MDEGFDSIRNFSEDGEGGTAYLFFIKANWKLVAHLLWPLLSLALYHNIGFIPGSGCTYLHKI